MGTAVGFGRRPFVLASVGTHDPFVGLFCFLVSVAVFPPSRRRNLDCFGYWKPPEVTPDFQGLLLNGDVPRDEQYP